MIKFSTPLDSLIKDKLLLFFIRSFVYLFVLFALITHQFLFSSFIDPNLSVFGYSLCFFCLFIESLFLYFYKEKQKDFSLFLFFLSALFLVSLNVLMGGSDFLFFIFFLIFLQAFPLLLFGRVFLAFMFLLYFSLLFPIAFAWEGGQVFEERLSLAVLTHFVLFFMFVFGLLFYLGLNLFQSKNKSFVDSINDDFNISADFLFLNFLKKIKPSLNSLMKYFSKEERAFSHVFSQQKGKAELEKLRKFVFDFIDFFELDKKLLPKENINIKLILNDSLNELKTHKSRPENLTLDVKNLDSFKLKGSASHLKKCFKNILINSFEALQNEKNPTIKIDCLQQKNWLFIQFLDNGQGIDEEDINKIFDPLFSKRFGLRGLGLFYVQKIIQAHFGEVAVERKAQWTKILVKLPLIKSYYDSFNFLKILKFQKKAS